MTARSSRSSSPQFSDLLSFTGKIRESTTRSVSDCVAALRANQSTSTWLGGYNTRLLLPKSRDGQKEVHFEIEYYRQSRRSSRSSHMVQRLRGVLYQESDRTHVIAKVRFTGASQIGLWAAVALTLVAVWLLAYTGNIIMVVLIGMAGSFLLAMIAVMWLDRYWLRRMVRRSLGE